MTSPAPTWTSETLTIAGSGLHVARAGTGAPVLVLHHDVGSPERLPFYDALARDFTVLVPSHPGYDKSERPAWLRHVRDVAAVYQWLLAAQDLEDVLVVGSSLGGWIAAEMAVRDSARRITGLVLIDAVGVYVEDEPIADYFALDPRAAAELSWHDPDRYYIDPAQLPADQLATRQANMATMRALAGDPYMHDPKLLRRLARVRQPALLVWGESDRIVTPAYGAAYAAAFADARLEIVPKAGHLPQLEQPEATFELIDAHLRRTTTSR